MPILFFGLGYDLSLDKYHGLSPRWRVLVLKMQLTLVLFRVIVGVGRHHMKVEVISKRSPGWCLYLFAALLRLRLHLTGDCCSWSFSTTP